MTVVWGYDSHVGSRPGARVAGAVEPDAVADVVVVAGARASFPAGAGDRRPGRGRRVREPHPGQGGTGPVDGVGIPGRTGAGGAGARDPGGEVDPLQARRAAHRATRRRARADPLTSR